MTENDTDPVLVALGRRSGWRRRQPISSGAAASRFSATPPTGRRLSGAGKEHPHRPRHRRRHRNRAAAARPAGRTRGRVNASSARRKADRPAAATGTDLGARPDRRHGQLRLRDRDLRGVGGGSARRRVAGRSRGERRSTGALYSAALGHGARVRRDGVDDAAAGPVRPSSCQCRWWAPGSLCARATAKRQAEILTRLLPSCATCGGSGSCALDLCMVAAGLLDALLRGRRHTSGTGRPVR